LRDNDVNLDRTLPHESGPEPIFETDADRWLRDAAAIQSAIIKRLYVPEDTAQSREPWALLHREPE